MTWTLHYVTMKTKNKEGSAAVAEASKFLKFQGVPQGLLGGGEMREYRGELFGPVAEHLECQKYFHLFDVHIQVQAGASNHVEIHLLRNIIF